jgi:PIN domain nuclease of toxin-antitoxin system
MSVDLLLDTHMLLWLVRGDARAVHLVPILEDDSSTVSVSAMSIAEIAIKHALGKLPDEPAATRRAASEHNLLELPFTGSHAEQMALLPSHHRDPFDRMIIAQALSEEMAIATSDTVFATYEGVTVVS